MKKTLPFYILFFFVFTCLNTSAQRYYSNYNSTPVSSLDISIGAGISHYYGDLTENAGFLSQSSYAGSIGLRYNLSDKFNIRSDFSYLKLMADDKNNIREDLKARNLNFTSDVWDITLGAGYNIFDLQEKYFTPTISAGAGICHFNPYTYDRNGIKQFLQPLGTEGQGLAVYPNRKTYNLYAFELFFGVGFKYKINENISFQLDFMQRKTSTDYLDDVSQSGYPDQNLLNQKNPVTVQLTYRGDEIRGGAPYPANNGLNRGNPGKKDIFYTTEMKLNFRLQNFYR